MDPDELAQAIEASEHGQLERIVAFSLSDHEAERYPSDSSDPITPPHSKMALDHRPEPGLIKWSSPNASHHNFLHIDLQNRVAQLYEATGHAQPGKFDYQKKSKSIEFRPLTTYDWSPSTTGLVAVGTSSGHVNLLRVDDNSKSYSDLQLKVKRPCQAVAFNTTNLLAVGLDRVRNDQSLHIWDVNRVSEKDTSKPGFPNALSDAAAEPISRLEPSVAVSSVKFFEDNPQTLAVGIRNSGIRVYDLRDPHGAAITFQTKCNNNLAIDYADQNYFASSSIDQPAVVVWDRRATARSSASPVYVDAVDQDDVPWGAALKLRKAVDVQPDDFDDKQSLIRSVRFCRDRRGLLAVLSRSGQLKVIETRKEFAEPKVKVEGSPELLEVRKSHELDISYLHDPKNGDRIVSFDWLPLESPILTSRVVVLRESGAFEILQTPSQSSQHLFKLVPWQAPFRGYEEGTPYHNVMRFDASEHAQMLGPMLVDQALSNVPLFGEHKADIRAIVTKVLQTSPPPPDEDCVQDLDASTAPLPAGFTKGTSTAAKLRALREYAQEHLETSEPDELGQSMERLSTGQSGPLSSKQNHEAHLDLIMNTRGFPKEAQVLLDHVALSRAKELYLFNYEKNREIVADDPWLRDMWGWIADAEKMASDHGMMAHGVDLSYMGAATIWANDLGNDPSTRLAKDLALPDRATLERCLRDINQRMGQQNWNGAETKWPAHRQACARLCTLGRTLDDFKDHEKTPASEFSQTWHTMATAHALFIGDPNSAVQILKKASTAYPELHFVSFALQLIGQQTDDRLTNARLDFDEASASKTDPYLRAISSFIATGDWQVVANQDSLPLRKRVFVAFRYLDDKTLTNWLDKQLTIAIETGDIEGIVLTGITDPLVDIFATYVEKYLDIQTASLVLSICAPKYMDDIRCDVWRKAYRAYLQRHKAFYQRTKFEVESSKKSKRGDQPTIKPPPRQIALRCVYCDAVYELANMGSGPCAAGERRNPLMSTSINAGVSCPSCGRHLPRCCICLEIVGVPRSDNPTAASNPAAMFTTFCLKCDHVMHLDHSRQWFARHVECPVPECRCQCNFRPNQDLSYH